ncbi:MAG: acylphosphatase [Alphaproteobacteria bacterium]|nr:acylphosphatase [Alphaproteobacteria bacterium]
MATCHCIISGRVQGVAYRAWTQREAQRRGLTGFVRNLPDGSVEALFCGAESAVQAMVEACRSGPALAQVTHIDADPADDPALPGFEILV